MQIHSDSSRIEWKLAVVESLIRDANDCIRPVNLRKAQGYTNRPITRLYALEVTAKSESKHAEESVAANDKAGHEEENEEQTSLRGSRRSATVEAHQQVLN